MVNAFACVTPGLECELDVLQAAAAMLQERMLCYAARGKAAKAAAIAAGPLLCVACRCEAFPLRSRPGAPGAVLPAPAAWNAADSAAQLWAQAKANAPAARCLLLRLGLQAGAIGWRGWAPPDRDAFPGPLPVAALALTDAWKDAVQLAGSSAGTGAGGEAGWLPQGVLQLILQRAEAVLLEGDAWPPAFTAAQPPRCAEAADALENAPAALVMCLLPLANALMGCGPGPGARAAEAARAARAGARLCGVAAQGGNQGARCA